MKTTKLIPVFMLTGMTFLTAGCIPEEDSKFELKNFDITTNNENSEGMSEIDPYQDNGLFTASWQAAYGVNDLYHARLHVSADTVLDDSDIHFFQQNCGEGGLYDCSEKAVFNCNYDTNNVISCPDTVVSDVNLTNFLSQNGSKAYIILEACAYDENVNEVCFEKNQAVEFK